MSWRTLGAVAPSDLRDARLQLHHAAQVVASAGLSLLEPQPDDSHPNLGWDEERGALMGRPLPQRGARVGLRVRDLSLILVDPSGAVADERPLDGVGVEDGYAWLSAAVVQGGGALSPRDVVRTSYEIPSHPTADGAAFSCADRPAFEELARWFANGHDALGELAARVPGASEVRCWPHHFDLGSLAVVATDPDGGPARSVGLGLSPGDASYEEPYWYVSPWPYPDATALPPLGGSGSWHTTGFTSALLTGSELIRGPRETQGDRLDAFLVDAVEKSFRIVSAGEREGS